MEREEERRWRLPKERKVGTGWKRVRDGEDGGEVFTPNRTQNKCGRDVGNGGDLDGERKKKN